MISDKIKPLFQTRKHETVHNYISSKSHRLKSQLIITKRCAAVSGILINPNKLAIFKLTVNKRLR